MRTPVLNRRRPAFGAFGVIIVVATLFLAVRAFSGDEEKVADGNSPQTVLAAQAQEEKTFRVGLQVGHLDAAELPKELNALSWNFGASAAGYDEVDVNQDTADAVAAILRSKGVEVDILPATIPPSYDADAFISFHADGNEDTTVSGFKVGASAFDTSGRAQELSDIMERTYGAATGMEFDPNVNENMTRYYAFNSDKFVHSIDSETPAILLELGFLTNSKDRGVFIKKNGIVSSAVAKALLEFLGVQP